MGAPASFGSPYSKVGISTANNKPAVGYYNVANNATVITTHANVANNATAIDDIGIKETLNVTGNKYFYYLVPGVGATNNALFTIVQPTYNANTHAVQNQATIAFANAATAGNKTLRLCAEDQDGMQYEQVMTITVT